MSLQGPGVPYSRIVMWYAKIAQLYAVVAACLGYHTCSLNLRNSLALAADVH